MGLTIHYNLRSDTTSPAKARQLVRQLRQRALDIPFQGVGEIVEYHGRDANFEHRANHDPDRWLLVQAGQYVDGCPYSVPPKHLIAFPTNPGPGSQEATFGLAAFPDTIAGEDGKQVHTDLTGWLWSSYCTTQFASLGGVENFLQSHLAVVKLLDAANDLGILGEVSDDGEFWDRRDMKALTEAVGEWNQDIARFVGHFSQELTAQSQKRALVREAARIVTEALDVPARPADHRSEFEKPERDSS